MDMRYTVLAAYAPEKHTRDTCARPSLITRQESRREESAASFHEMLESAYRRERREASRTPERRY